MGFSPETQIGTLIDFSRGGGWGKEAPFEGSTRVAVVRGADFPDVEAGRYTSLPFRYEKEAKARNVALRTGDIVLENSGGTDTRPTGRTVLISQELLDVYDCPVIPASFCRIVRFNASVDSEFIYYWLQNMFNAGRTWGYQNRSTGLSNFQFRTFAEMELVPDLSLETQRQIGRILAMLDKKRLNNNRLNGYLAALLDASYSLATENGAEVKTLPEVVDIFSGGTPKTGNPEYWEGGNIPFFAPGDVTRSVYALTTEKHITEMGLANCNSSLYPIDTVFLTARGTVGKVAIAGNPMAMNQSCFAFRGKDIPQSVVFQIIKHAVKSLKAKANGATFAAINTRDLGIERVAIPSKDAMHAYDRDASVWLSEILTNEKENLRLANLRDALLPKLMSGEIDVSRVDLTQLNSHLA